MKKRISRTLKPLLIHKGIDQAHVKGLVPNLDALSCLWGGTHQGVVVAQAIDHHSTRSIELCIFGACRGAGQNEKLLRIGNQTMCAHARQLYSLGKRFAETLP